MSNDSTSISWTTSTWNPVTGCTHVSEGCRHCYAEALSLRFGHTSKPWIKPHEAENVKLHPERLDVPRTWKKPRRIFVNSMSDLFHPLVPFDFVERVWDVMFECPQHVFQILTKRPERMREFAQWMNDRRFRRVDYENVWLGTSVEDQRAADERIPDLIVTPAAVRFLSVEPMLGPVELGRWIGYGPMPPDVQDALTEMFPDGLPANSLNARLGEWQAENRRRLHWVIVGGESGPQHRPMDVRWMADIAERCAGADIAVWIKQDSHRMPERQGRIPDELWRLKQWPTVGEPASGQVALPGVGA